MKPNTNTPATNSSPHEKDPDTVVLDGEHVRAIRHDLHELANVFTGVMICSGLLQQYLEGGSLGHYADDISQSSERGSLLVRQIRSRMLIACGEAESVDTQFPLI